MEERLQKVIANSGYTSRRKAEELITKGKVLVNNKVVKELGTKVTDADEIIVDGVTLEREVKKEYYLLYKPSGYICSLSDEHNRKIITELIDTKTRIYPVGRLDYDTTGLIILTNDGELSNLLMHPTNGVEKVYRATVSPIMKIEDFLTLKNKGVTVNGRKVKPSRIKIKSKNENKNSEIIEISLIEGRNHIVKNIFKEFGSEVIKLKRERYAFLNLDGLAEGGYRELNLKEVKKLYSLKKNSK